MQDDNSSKNEDSTEHDGTSTHHADQRGDEPGDEPGTGTAPQTLSVEGDGADVRTVSRGASSRTSDSEIDGDDEETWTNAPVGAASNEQELSRDEGEEEEEEEEEAPVVTRKVIQNARDVLCEELPVRAERAKLRLRPQLTGAFLIEVSNTGEKFIFDWRGQEPKVSPVEGTVELAAADNVDPSKVDSIISVSDQHLMAIRSGDLNPQVAMLADKIRVKGKMGPAVYLFNLVAPRVRD
jgi:hypothetical protein